MDLRGPACNWGLTMWVFGNVPEPDALLSILRGLYGMAASSVGVGTRVKVRADEKLVNRRAHI